MRGKVSGKVVKSNQPINFLGSVDKKTGEVTDQKHDLFGKKIAGSILVFPNGVGSSVGAYTIYSLKSNNSAPAAMACQKVDLTVASGCALANIPLFILSPDEYDSMKDGDEVSLGYERQEEKKIQGSLQEKIPRKFRFLNQILLFYMCLQAKLVQNHQY